MDDSERDFSRVTLQANIEAILRDYRDVHPHSMARKIVSAIPVCAKPLPIDKGLVERVALAITKEIGWGTFSHFDPEDVRRIARAAIEVMLGGRDER